MQNFNRFTSSARVQDYPNDAVPYIFAATTINGVSSWRSEHALESFFARGILNFSNKFEFNLSLRADGTSRFRGANEFGLFPAISVAWRISNASFFPKNNFFVSSLKLRASAAENGNQQIANYVTYNTFSTGLNYPGAGGKILGGVAPQSIGNKDLQWESTTQYDLGLDAGLFNDRLSITFDAYLKRTNNLLLNVNLPPHVAFGSVLENIGKLSNKGLELSVKSVNIQRRFSWRTSFNISMNRNKVISLGKEQLSNGHSVSRKIIGGNTIIEAGHPLNAFYGYVVKGIFQNENEIKNSATQNGAAPGDLRFADLNGDGIINGHDRRIIGNPYPDFSGGILNTFSFRGLSLSILFQGSYGSDIYDGNIAYLRGMYKPNNAVVAVLNRWTPKNRNTNIPRAVEGDPNDNRRPSTRFITNGTYLRLKNLSLSYNFSPEIISKLGLRNLKVYVRGRNLVTFTRFPGYNPDIVGEALGQYPVARVYTVGFDIKF